MFQTYIVLLHYESSPKSNIIDQENDQLIKKAYIDNNLVGTTKFALILMLFRLPFLGSHFSIELGGILL